MFVCLTSICGAALRQTTTPKQPSKLKQNTFVVDSNPKITNIIY